MLQAGSRRPQLSRTRCSSAHLEACRLGRPPLLLLLGHLRLRCPVQVLVRRQRVGAPLRGQRLRMGGSEAGRTSQQVKHNV